MSIPDMVAPFDVQYEPLKKDGRLIIDFINGSQETYLFEEIKGWRTEFNWVIIIYGDRSYRWPTWCIRGIECINNSAEYTASRAKSPRDPDHYTCVGCGSEMHADG